MSQDLPIEAIKSDFLQTIAMHQLILLTAPPGAGKSTRLPLWLLELDKFANKKIYLLQPRRVAAKNIATYLASQLGEKVGERVGYRLRNDTKVSKTTILEVVTEGVLTQIIQQDPELAACAMVILDEFHERSVHAELAFALCRDIQQSLREDLVLVLMSATLNHQSLVEQLPDAVELHSEGRTYPVEISYLPAKSVSMWREHTLQVIRNTIENHAGSILVFLPGVSDILLLKERLEAQLPKNKSIAPLYGDLPLNKQQLAIAPSAEGVDKIVLTTNIAETSLTIEGVNLVIDVGLEKVAQFDQQSLTNVLVQQQTAKSSCVQRAGRAGRLMAGKCIRLFSQDNFDRRAETTTPEILQTDILPVVIEAARWGVNDLEQMPFLQLPAAQKVASSWLQAQQLGLVDDKRRLTQHGEQVSRLPCHPRFAHMVLVASSIEKEHQISELTKLACLLAVMLEERDILSNSSNFQQADFHLRLDKLSTGKAGFHIQQRIFQQTNKLYSALRRQKSDNINKLYLADWPTKYCGELVAIAYPERLANRRNKGHQYTAVNGKGLELGHDDSLSQFEFIAVARARKNQRNNNLQILLAAGVDIKLLEYWQQIKLQSRELLIYDQEKNKIRTLLQTCIGDLVIDEKSQTNKLTPEKVSKLWQQLIQQQGISWLNWRDNDISLRARWQWLNQYQSDISMPDISEQGLLTTTEKWFMPFVADVTSKAQLDKLSLSEMLLSLLDYQQQQDFKRLAPKAFITVSGRQYKISYSKEKSPKISLPMQELYGEKTTPCLGEGKNTIALTLELLSPAKRPIQLTQDLAGFWQGSYKQVQKEMKSRYPKHYWPDDPANAKPTLKTKKQMK